MEREIDLAPQHLVDWLRADLAGRGPRRLEVRATREFLAEDGPLAAEGLDADDGMEVLTTVGLLEVAPAGGGAPCGQGNRRAGDPGVFLWRARERARAPGASVLPEGRPRGAGASDGRGEAQARSRPARAAPERRGDPGDRSRAPGRLQRRARHAEYGDRAGRRRRAAGGRRRTIALPTRSGPEGSSRSEFPLGSIVRPPTPSQSRPSPPLRPGRRRHPLMPGLRF